MNACAFSQEDLVKKVRDGLQRQGFIVLPLTELDPVFGDDEHAFERVLQLHEFAMACDADCEMADEQDVRFCQKHAGPDRAARRSR